MVNYSRNFDDWFKDFVESTVGSSRHKAIRDSSDSCSVDLTEALDPEWYFRDRPGAEYTEYSHGDLLKAPGTGQIRQVGFGKQKVAFIDVLGTGRRL